MSLEEALQQLVPKPKPQGCKTCAWLNTQTPAVRDHVRDWLVENHSTKQLHEVLRAHDYPLSIGALKLHAEHAETT